MLTSPVCNHDLCRWGGTNTHTSLTRVRMSLALKLLPVLSPKFSRFVRSECRLRTQIVILSNAYLFASSQDTLFTDRNAKMSWSCFSSWLFGARHAAIIPTGSCSRYKKSILIRMSCCECYYDGEKYSTKMVIWLYRSV